MTGEADAAFVDTNVLVYAFDRRRTEKKPLAAHRLLAELTESGRLRLSTQVMQELYYALIRKGEPPYTPEDALDRLNYLSHWPIYSNDYSAIREAIQLSIDAVLSFWDALIVIAAVRSGAAVLYTEDLNHGQKLLGLEIVNPFR